MLSSLKGKMLYSILNAKCPRCHEGTIYINKNPYTVKGFGKAKETCAYCGLKYEKEPGFFYGAMYVSYALTVAISVAIGVAIYVLTTNTPYWVYILSIFLGLLILMPINFRLSRTIWLNIFQRYDANASKQKLNK